MLIALLAGKDTPQATEMLEEAKRLSGKQKSVTISFLTDMEKLKRGTGSEELLANSSKASIDRQERATMASKVEKRGGAVVKTEAEALAMLDQADEVGKMLDENALATAQSVKAYQTKDYVALGKLLALATTVANAIGLWLCLSKIRESKDVNEIRYAWFGVGDSAAGIVGGLLELWAVGQTGKDLAAASPGTTPEMVTAHSGWLTGLRMGVALSGVVAGILNGYVNWANGDNADKSGDIAVARLYYVSAYAFGGTFSTSSGLAASLWLARAFVRVEERAAVSATTRAIVRFAARRGGRWCDAVRRGPGSAGGGSGLRSRRHHPDADGRTKMGAPHPLWPAQRRAFR